VVEQAFARYDARTTSARSPSVTWSTLFQLIVYLVVLMAVALIPITIWLAGVVFVTGSKRPASNS
jgi:hypothetical protein